MSAAASSVPGEAANPVVAALSLLTPFDVDKRKVRIGPPGDGGYVFVDDIQPEQAVLSYGIGKEFRFDELMARRGHDVYMFDHTIDGAATRRHPKMRFFREGVAGVSDPAASLHTVMDHLERNGIEGDRLIMKMDVEGAEFDALAALPAAVLKRFEQIVFEIHGLYRLGDPAFRARFTEVIGRLNEELTLFHVHANNFDGPDALRIVGGVPVSNLLELSYVRTATVKRSPSRTLYPTELDYPNTPKADKLLWFYPFAPTGIDASDYRACALRAQERGRPKSG